MKSFPQRFTIGDDCQEHFLNYQIPGVKLSGISKLTAPYEMSRPNNRDHILLYCVSGSGAYITETVEGTFSADKGFLFPADAPHRYFLRPGEKLEIFWVHIDASFYNTSGDMKVVSDDHFGDLLNCARLMLKEETRQASTIIDELSHVFIQLLVRIVRGDGDSSRQRLENLMNQIRGSLHTEWSIERMADYLACSQSHLHRLFSTIMDSSPHKVLTDLRIKRVSDFLTSTDYSLDRIAELTGYGNGFSLSKAYKKNVGISPKNYRDSRDK